MTNPSGCRWCGIDQREHCQQFHREVGWHTWEEPTWSQRRERMLERYSSKGRTTSE